VSKKKQNKKGGEKMRVKKHQKYYAIPAYQILCKKTDDEMAQMLGICTRTYKEKIEGYSDFTLEQGKKLSLIFGKTQEEIFLI
jgi:plasmid maintenance system antidote protein VapI